MDDWQLLKNYAVNHSEEAFRALVERYAGMVYHAALRQTGNPHAAEEAAQVVFIALAQKARSIPRQATLYGWLFRATRFAVLNQVRKNANRERREQEALVMQPTMEPNEADSTWERLTPQLNDALDSLCAADRELLMNRYFGNKSHKEVAEALGLSEETARKRISRAMERLREIFARRGVVLSSLALTAAFATHGNQPAPIASASSWAEVAMAKAAAGTAASSAGGIFAFVTSAKVAVLIAALVLGGAAFALLKSVSRGSLVAVPLATNLAISQRTPDTNGSLTGPTGPSKPAGDAVVSATALDKVKAALHDPNPTTVYPNSVMQEAIAGLGDKKKTSLPILEAALHEADAQVRLRAVDGLGIIGPEASKAAAPLLGVLRAGGVGEAIPQTSYAVRSPMGAVRAIPIYTDNVILYALGQIHPSPEILPEFARMIKENRSVCQSVYRATRQFPGVRRSLMDGGWLWAIAHEDAKALNKAFRPLLQDPGLAVRCTAAISLVSALGDQADAGVFPVAAELLKTRNLIGEQDGLSLMQGGARDPSPAGASEKFTLYAPRLGPYLNETASALADAAYHGASENVRLAATKMLDVLAPDLRKFNPSLAAVLERQSQLEVFTSKVVSGEATTPEILEGLKEFPKAAPDIAANFALRGSNAVEWLPAFAEALSALAPLPGTNSGDGAKVEWAEAINMRQRLADVMQRLAPERPKPIFTGMDVIVIRRIMRDPVVQADPDRSQRISEACKLAGWPGVGIIDVSPDEVRRLLAAMKNADAPTYDALAAKVKEIDPRFSENSAR